MRFAYLRRGLTVYLFFLGLAVVATYPAVTRLTTHFIGDGGDGVEYLSYQYIASRNLYDGKYPFAYSYMYRFPLGFNFGVGSDARLFVLLGAVLLPIFGDALTFNGLFLLLLAFNGWAAYLFFRWLTKSDLVAVIGGVMYGFSYFVLARGAGGINIMQSYGYPLIMLAFVRLVKKINLWNIFLFLASFLLIALASLQHLLISLALVLASYPLLMVFYWREGAVFLKECFRGWFKWLAIGVLVAGIFVTFFYHFLAAWWKGDLPGRLSGRPIKTIHYFIPSPFLRTIAGEMLGKVMGTEMRPEIDDAVFVGWVETGLFVLAVVWGRKTKLDWLFISLTVVFVGVALGNQPWGLKRLFPFNVISESERFEYVFYLFMTGVIVRFISQVRVSGARRALMVLAIVLGLLVERVGFDYFTIPILSRRGSDYQRVVAGMKEAGVLDLPVIIRRTPIFWESEYNLLPFYYGKSIVGGYFHWLAETHKTPIGEKLKLLTCDLDMGGGDEAMEYFCKTGREVLTELAEQKVGVVVVHKTMLDKPECEIFRTRLSGLFSGGRCPYDLRLVYTDSEADVYETGF